MFLSPFSETLFCSDRQSFTSWANLSLFQVLVILYNEASGPRRGAGSSATQTRSSPRSPHGSSIETDACMVNCRVEQARDGGTTSLLPTERAWRCGECGAGGGVWEEHHDRSAWQFVARCLSCTWTSSHRRRSSSWSSPRASPCYTLSSPVGPIVQGVYALTQELACYRDQSNPLNGTVLSTKLRGQGCVLYYIPQLQRRHQLGEYEVILDIQRRSGCFSSWRFGDDVFVRHGKRNKSMKRCLQACVIVHCNIAPLSAGE